MPTDATYTDSSPILSSVATSTKPKPWATSLKTTNTAATTACTSTSAPSSLESDQHSHTFPQTTIIAASAAGVVAFIVIFALVWTFLRRHYRNKLATGGKEQTFPLSSNGFSKLPDKSARPVEVPAPLHSPAPPYQPPAYQNSPYTTNGVVDIDDSYLPPQRNQWGQPVFEVSAQPYRQT
ncbi:Nn.00g100540.m01.CDS01 [Neocucurbitaria sp. VM-36]